jgi:pyruvate dehydrogenase E2 component (dihydrolipoamide acetyltransferase)
MNVDILVPPLSQTMDSLIFVSWLKKTGESIEKGEPLFSVETDKATLEVEAPTSGILKECLASPGDEIKIRSIIGQIDDHQGLSDKVEVKRRFSSPRARRLSSQMGIDMHEIQGSGPRGAVVARDVQDYLTKNTELSIDASVKATPLARRIAQAEGVNLESIQPARPGPIKKGDIQNAISKLESGTPEIEKISHADDTSSKILLSSQKLPAVRRTIANRLQQGHLAGVAVTYVREIDVTKLVKLRKRILDHLPEGSDRPTITDFLVLFVCKALITHPEFNATFDGETIQIFPQVDLCLAIDTPKGLFAPIIRNAQIAGLETLAHNRRVLVERATNGSLSLEELSGGTFTLTNLGSIGIDIFTPVLNPPQVAILGVGRIEQKPVVRRKKVRIRDRMNLSLTCDHRVIDGAPAARFLETLCAFIEQPELYYL